MFSRLLHSSAAFFFPYNTSKELDSSFQVDQQIGIELEQAAEQGMVSTRSQDNTPAGGASLSSKQLYPQVVVFEKKRKADGGAEESPTQAVTKRRYRSAKSNGDAAHSSSASEPGRPRKKAYEKSANGDAVNGLNGSESEQEHSTKGSRRTSPQMLQITMESTIHDVEVKNATEPAIKMSNQTLNLDDEALEVHDQAKPDTGSATRSRKGNIRKKRAKDTERTARVNEKGSDISMPEKEPGTPPATATKATHKRFDSDDIEVLGLVPSSSIEEPERSHEDISEDEDKSGDEAPETVTASASFNKARIAALEAAKVAAAQEAEKKLKRRELDQRLRLQAKSANESRSKEKPPTKIRRTKGSLAEAIEADGQMPVEEPQSSGESPQIIKDDERKPPAKPKFPGKTPLPLLLPEEILAVEPVADAPLPTFSNSKPAISQRRKFLDLEPKPPKDIKRGNVNIRVLQDNRSILPPKSSQASKALRESWLTGRTGFKGKIGIPRRKPSDGFVRKK